ncbi:DUF2267 domain-containing protein [Streptomyces pristinaespiralis]|uniref:DUF2267 domain-containing protein n=1 Tax=Streptomyces pristinaespiralis TaxID=38300 RepID=UPI0033FA2AD3
MAEVSWEEFLADVRERGQYTTGREAERVARIVLPALGGHLADPERKELAERLETPGSELLLDPAPATTPLGPRAFVETVADLIEGATDETARWDTGAVLTTLADLAGQALLARVLVQLPSGYALLFGRAELS